MNWQRMTKQNVWQPWDSGTESHSPASHLLHLSIIDTNF